MISTLHSIQLDIGPVLQQFNARETFNSVQHQTNPLFIFTFPYYDTIRKRLNISFMESIMMTKKLMI